MGFLSFFIAPEISEWITGKITTTTVFIEETPQYNCSVNLSRGLNMVSFPCEPEQYDFYGAFKDEQNNTLNFTYIFQLNLFDATDPWKSYNIELPNWTIQNIPPKLDRRRGYFIYVEEPGVYFSEGLRFENTNIALKRGWNLVGYPSDNIKNISDAISTIENEYVHVYSYQQVNNNKEWLYHTKNEGGTLEYFTPGYAYWIYVTADTTWGVTW
jgi:hypothetical protein